MNDEEPKYDPIEIEGVVEIVPPSGSLYADVIGQVIETGSDGWTVVRTGGRSKSSVQTGLLNAAKAMGVKVKTKSREQSDGTFKVYCMIAEEKG